MFLSALVLLALWVSILWLLSFRWKLPLMLFRERSTYQAELDCGAFKVWLNSVVGALHGSVRTRRVFRARPRDRALFRL